MAAFMRSETLPELRPLLERVASAGTDEQDAEQQLAAARAFAATVGASVEEA